MEKKEFKMYEAPAVELVEMEVQSVICTSVEGGDDVTDGSYSPW